MARAASRTWHNATALNITIGYGEIEGWSSKCHSYHLRANRRSQPKELLLLQCLEGC
jgi:hypothetical protein